MEYVSDVSLWASLLQEHGYELLGRLDSGSFSEVFAVRSIASQRVLAVKRMVARREISSDPRILKEIACLRQLNIRGACVIRLEGTIWKLDRLACLVLELAPLGDLERYAAEHRPLSPKLVVSTVRQVLSALTHCHRLQIAHRDVNPANVLLMSERSVRLADFGLAFHCKDASGRRVLCEDYLGRDAYMAPEVLHCLPYDALLADMWSVSSLCLFMLTGEHPPPYRSPPASEDDGEDRDSVPCSLYHTPRSGVVKEPLPIPSSNHDRRHSSHDSEGSSRSESDLEEPLPQSPIPDLTPEHVCPRDSQSDDCCQWKAQADPTQWTANSPEEDLEVFRESTTPSGCSVVHRLVAKLRVERPPHRLKAEEALKFWKNVSS